MGRYAGRKVMGKKGYTKDPFEKVVCYVPKSLIRDLKIREDIYGVSVDRLITRSALNAIGGGSGFEFDYGLLTGASNIEDERKAFAWLCKFDDGVDLDLMVMSYEEIGLKSPIDLRVSLTSLVVKSLVETYFDTDDQVVPKIRHLGGLIKRRGYKDKMKTFAGSEVSYGTTKRYK